MNAVFKSDDYVSNERGSCKGTIKETVSSSTITKVWACQCHDSMYQLVRNTLAAITQSQRNNPEPAQQPLAVHA